MYGTLDAANSYHQARGNAAWALGTDEARTGALVRATDYIDGRYRVLLASGRWASMFPGVRTEGRGQANEWPRTGARDYGGNLLRANVVPDEVERATYEAALRELASPGSLSPDYVASEAVTKEKVGPIEVTYADAAAAGQVPNRPVVPAIDEILAPLLRKPALLPAVRVV
ncbi:DnaT-like ssDNA-binding protein [Stenotrophomonas sp. C3(2023)]|uniref:DnaT-like ssDNA-binding protein n=1 Tax=Stenotrophomonas sp. C3(2023) TaxID=3080277 RepID=UPI00293CBA28|nr:DnaT-like ssDNA-binding protein [Stenotrophomonas sp. C3(2023)]MDV3469013.1 DnaT-like ssDNA-binding protein [Stenotrophomonas sp. C3(2023)]